jgi:hypothetical protein
MKVSIAAARMLENWLDISTARLGFDRGARVGLSLWAPAMPQSRTGGAETRRPRGSIARGFASFVPTSLPIMSLAHTLRLPYPGYLRIVLWKSAGMWLLTRMLLFAFFAIVFQVGIAAALQPTWGLPSLLVWLERKRCHEQLLHANLGASELWFWAVSLLTVFTLDAAATVLLGGLLGIDFLG